MKFALILTFAAGAWAQTLDLSSLDKLVAKAKEHAVITMDPEKLKLAAGFLSGDDDKAKKVQQLSSKLKGMTIRTFEFESPGQYALSDLDAVRAQLRGPNWSRFLEVKEKDESVEIWFYTQNGQSAGMTILAAEPKELSVISIAGTLDLSTLGTIVPNLNLNMGGTRSKPSREKQDDDDEDN